MKTETIRARIDPVLKGEAEEIIGELGLTPSAVIQMLYKQIVFTRGVPFEVRMPNAETLAAMAELKSGKGHSANNVNEMLKRLRGDEECEDALDGRHDSKKISAGQ